MVSTRGRTSQVRPSILKSEEDEDDTNRIIAVVTGANSGFGLGICQQLLSNLSLPIGTPMPASKPRKSALAPYQQYLLDNPTSTSTSSEEEEVGEPTKTIPSSAPTLTLILACRSERKALQARSILLDKHEKELEKRKKNGISERKGWKRGLRIIWEPLDLDSLGGKNGVLTFCERLKTTYPHITSLFLNAGMGAFTGVDWIEFVKSIVTRGLPIALSRPTYQLEAKGVMSADGERGMVWSTNVLAQYIMATELLSLLRQSPSGLAFTPRVVYTSSCTAYLSNLHPNPLEDYQLLQYEHSYSASKYMGDLVMCQLDKTFSCTESNSSGSNSSDGEGSNSHRDVRVFNADPGCVTTNLFAAGFGIWAWWSNIQWFANWIVFYFTRLIGSPYHPVYPDQGALPMIYAALIPDEYLVPSSKVPATKFSVVSERWGRTTVAYGEVDRWEEGEDIGRGVVQRCESIKKEWKIREGI